MTIFVKIILVDRFGFATLSAEHMSAFYNTYTTVYHTKTTPNLPLDPTNTIFTTELCLFGKFDLRTHTIDCLLETE